MEPSQAFNSNLAEAGRHVAVLGKRRKFLVNKRYQLKASLITGSLVLVLLVFINVMLYQASLRGTAQILADAPELSQVIRTQDNAQRVLIALASLVFLGGVIVVGIIETHRTAGAAFNIRRQLGEVASGRYSTRVRLRKGDHLRELEAGFNAMAEAVSSRVSQDNATLRQLADEAEAGADGVRIASGLRELADRNDAMIPPLG